MNIPGPIEILLIEDNSGDILLAKEAFSMSGISANINTAADGAEAIEYLRRQDQYSDAVRPELILLDINMPRMGGKEFLQWVKNDAQFLDIPIVVFTSSQSKEDITACYKLHANAYLVKPSSLKATGELIVSLIQFWFAKAEMPCRYMKKV